MITVTKVIFIKIDTSLPRIIARIKGLYLRKQVRIPQFCWLIRWDGSKSGTICNYFWYEWIISILLCPIIFISSEFHSILYKSFWSLTTAVVKLRTAHAFKEPSNLNSAITCLSVRWSNCIVVPESVNIRSSSTTETNLTTSSKCANVCRQRRPDKDRSFTVLSEWGTIMQFHEPIAAGLPEIEGIEKTFVGFRFILSNC